MATDYNTESLIGGKYFTAQEPLAADTYYKGMPLKANASGYYEYDSTVLSTVAIYLGDGESSEVIGTNADRSTVITFGEIQEAGIVDDSGDAITITQAMRVACAANGLYIKRS